MTEQKIQTPKSLIKFERQYGEMLRYVISKASEQFKNQALLVLNKKTQKKFADEQAGNYADIFVTLSNQVQRKILARFSDDRLLTATQPLFNKIDKNNKKRLYSAISRNIGLDVKQIVNKESKKVSTAALIKSTQEWASKTLADSLQIYSANALRAMTLGQDLDSIILDFDNSVSKRKNHVEMVARTQVSTFNGLLTKNRVQNLGLNEAVWETADDDRVRRSHADRDNKTYKLDTGLYSSIDDIYLFPGVDYNCRCTSSFVIPKDF